MSTLATSAAEVLPHHPPQRHADIPVGALRASPTNPRKRFDETALRELADSIVLHGVLQPILVRPAETAAAAGGAAYEIVCGERRWRASALAEQSSIPAVVRPMSDFQVVEVQMIENLEREDLNELEEAQGYAALLRKPGATEGYATVDDLAARLGKSRSYVFQRLKLLDLCDNARQALEEGKLSFSIALLIARLHDVDDQSSAVRHIVAGWGGEPYTFKQAESWIRSQFHLDLARAPFPIADAALLAAAGACQACAKRTAAMGDLFPEQGATDSCLDPECYETKAQAHRDRAVADARERGLHVLAGKQAAKVPVTQGGGFRGFLELDKTYVDIGSKPLRALLGKHNLPVTAIEVADGRGIVEVVREADARNAIVAAGKLKGTAGTDNNISAGSSGSASNLNDQQRKAKRETAFRTALASELLRAAHGSAGADASFRADLLVDGAILLWSRLPGDVQRRAEKLLAWPAANQGSGLYQRRAADEKRIRSMGEADFTRFLVACLAAGDVYVNEFTVARSKPVLLLNLATRLGINADAVREATRELQRAPATRRKARGVGASSGSAEDAGQTSVTPETALATAIRKAGAKARGKTDTKTGRKTSAGPAASISATAADPFRAQ